MDDPAAFTAFIRDVLNITVPQCQNKIISFASTFCKLLATTEEEIDSFISNTHSTNSGRAANGKVLLSKLLR